MENFLSFIKFYFSVKSIYLVLTSPWIIESKGEGMGGYQEYKFVSNKHVPHRIRSWNIAKKNKLIKSNLNIYWDKQYIHLISNYSIPSK